MKKGKCSWLIPALEREMGLEAVDERAVERRGDEVIGRTASVLSRIAFGAMRCEDRDCFEAHNSRKVTRTVLKRIKRVQLSQMKSGGYAYPGGPVWTGFRTVYIGLKYTEGVCSS